MQSMSFLGDIYLLLLTHAVWSSNLSKESIHHTTQEGNEFPIATITISVEVQACLIKVGSSHDTDGHT